MIGYGNYPDFSDNAIIFNAFKVNLYVLECN